MRIWDISPGYLNRQSLLGEHRELHGIVSVIVNSKKGYARHPETLRWVNCIWALKERHRQLRCEMMLRGYRENSPVEIKEKTGKWPAKYIDDPYRQIQILKQKYKDKECGRIPLPKNAQQLWSHHKYSVLARDPGLYRKLGREVSDMKAGQEFVKQADELTKLLRQVPPPGNLRNALQHMWGYVSQHYISTKDDVDTWSSRKLIREIQILALETREPYLTSSTALSDLDMFCQD